MVLPLGNSKLVSNVSFQPNGPYIVTTGGNSLLWIAKNGKLLREYNSPVFEWDNEGKRTIVRSDEKELLIFNFQTGDTLVILKGHKSGIVSAKWSPDGNRIISMDNESQVIVWDARTGKPLREWEGKSGRHEFSKDGKFILTTMKPAGEEGSLLLMDASNYNKLFTFHGERLIYLEGKGKAAAYFKAGYKNNTLTIYDLTKTKQVKQIKNIIAVSDNGLYAMTGKKDKFKLYDVLTGKKMFAYKSERLEFIERGVISPDGKLIAVYDWGQQVIVGGFCSEYSNHKHILRVLEAATGKQVAINDEHRRKINAIEWTSDSKNVLTSDYNNVTKLWNASTGKVAYNFTGYISGKINGLQVSPDSTRLATTTQGRNGFSDNLKIYELFNGSLVYNLKGHCYSINSLNWSPDGKKIVTGSDDSKAIVWSMTGGVKLMEIDKMISPVNKAIWTNDGKKIITVSGGNGTDYKGEILMFSAENGKLDKKFMVKNTNVNALELSPDGTKIVTGAEGGDLKIWNLKSGSTVKTLIGHKELTFDAHWINGGKNIYSTSHASDAIVWDVLNGKVIQSYQADWFATDLSHDETKIVVKESDYTATVYELLTRKKIASLYSKSKLYTVNWSNNDKKIHGLTDAGMIVWDPVSGKQISEEKEYAGAFRSFIKSRNLGFSFSDFSINIYNFQTNAEIAKIYSFDTLNYFVITHDNYYLSSTGTLKLLNFRMDNQLYAYEQFDLKYNRPDIVLERLGFAEKAKVEAFRKAYLKRIKKMGFTEDMLKDDIHLPELKIKDFEHLPADTDKSELNLEIELNDTHYKLDRINVFINDVAVYGLAGINLRELNTSEHSRKLNIELAEGMNKVQISVLNQAGAESYKETVEIVYKPLKPVKHDLYLVSIGDSKYADTVYNLTYASKDATDIEALFQKNAGSKYGAVYTYKFTDKEVTIGNIMRVKNQLMRARRDDVVIITVAGHGVLDKDLNYYLATYDMDFSNPAAKGLPYDMLESLVDGIAPLRKVILLDACHSGEVDKEEVEQLAKANTKTGEVKFRAAGAGIQKKTIGLKTAGELMNEVFTDLRKGTGATVISSASGAEYAMESDLWKNGLFTYCMLHGLKEKAADANGDGQIMLSELQNHLRLEVYRLSNGAQQPTSRIENMSMDFRVW